MSPIDYFTNAFSQKYADFSGRARRSEYWYFMLFHILAAILFAVISGVTEYIFIYTIYIFGSLLPGLATTVRRLHDIDKSGWWILVSLVPFVGGIILLVFLCQEGDRNQNQYGLDPKAPLELNDDITKHLVD